MDPEQWVDRHGDALFRFALLRVRDRALAEELVQEAMLAAFRGRGRFEGRARERTWMIQILRNKIADHFRRKGREIPVTDLGATAEGAEDLFDDRGRWRDRPSRWPPDPGSLLEAEEFRSTLADCLRELPGRQADAFALRVMDDRASDEVRNLLGVTATNLGVLLHRARMRLRRCLSVRWFGREDD